MSSSHTFVHQIQNLINWVETDAVHLTKEELLDSIKIRVLDHCWCWPKNS